MTAYFFSLKYVNRKVDIFIWTVSKSSPLGTKEKKSRAPDKLSTYRVSSRGSNEISWRSCVELHSSAHLNIGPLIAKTTSQQGYQSQQTPCYWAGHLLSPTSRHGARLPQPTKHLDVRLGEPVGPDVPSARTPCSGEQWHGKGEEKRSKDSYYDPRLRLGCYRSGGHQWGDQVSQPKPCRRHVLRHIRYPWKATWGINAPQRSYCRPGALRADTNTA